MYFICYFLWFGLLTVNCYTLKMRDMYVSFCICDWRYVIGMQFFVCVAIPADIRRNNNVIMMSKRRCAAVSYPMAIVSNLTNSTLSSFMISSIIMIISFHFISHFMSSLYLYHLSSLPISSHLTVSLIWYIISHLIVNPIHHINSPNCSSLI